MEWGEFFEVAFTHRRSFFFLTAVECLIFAFVIFIPNYKKHFSGVRLWAIPFSLTFLALGLMYLVHYSSIKIGIPSESNDEVVRFILSGCSNLSLFLTAVIIRKDFGERLFSRELIKGGNGIGFILIILCAFSAVLAKIFDKNPQNIDFTTVLLEIPDHIASSIVLICFAVIIFRELAFRRSRTFAVFALLSTIVYAGLFIFHVFNISNLMLENSWGVAPERASAGVTFISFFLKAGLFFPTYFLITSTSNEFSGILELLKNVTQNRVEFLESEGILKKIVEILKADKITLTIILPGKERKLVSAYQYPATPEYNADPQKKPKITLRDITGRDFEKEVYEQVFNNHSLTYNVHNYPDNLNSILRSKIEGSKETKNTSLIAVPIKYHGAIIGCLEVYLDKSSSKLSFSRTDVLQIQRIAVLLTRAIQANREVAGLDQLITRMGSLQTDLHELKANDAINKILEVLDDLFSPLALGIYTDIGFKSHLLTFSENSNFREEIKTQLQEDIPKKIEKLNVMPIYNSLIVPSFKNFKFLTKEAEVLESIKERTFGQLVAYIPPENDKYDSPTLFNYHLYCRVISNIVTDAYLDFARDYFNHHLKELTIKLNSPDNSDLATWFTIVEDKIIEVDLLWAVVSKEDPLNEHIGENMNFVKSLFENDKPKYQSELIDLYHLETQADNKANHVIKIKLTEFGGYLWLGVERQGFGSEIERYETSPWKTFLERLAEISDSALHKIIEKDEKDEKAKEAAEFHGLATAAVTTGTLLHQIGNQVKEVTFPIDNLKNSLNLGRLRGTKESWQRIFGLIESAKKLEELTQLLGGIVKIDSHRPCRIGEIIEESKKLFDGALEQYKIKFDNTLTMELLSKEIDIPFFVGSFALTNLVMNAKDEIKINKIVNGFIRIEAEENETSILLHVTDNGLGVPPKVQNKIFDKGFTTKTDAANFSTGLGLFFTAHSLRENGALVQLTNPGPNPPTKFTISFPKPRKEKM